MRRTPLSLKSQAISSVPAETVRVARAAYPKGNVYIQMRKVLGSISFPKDGQPAEDPWRLALVTVRQCVENLSDEQAANAVRGRIDWNYLLELELTDAGFDASILSEFRARLGDHRAEERLREKMLTIFRHKGWLKARGKQRTASTHVLGKIRALNSLAIVAPDWLRAQSQEEWVERYGPRSEDSRFPPGKGERKALAEEIGEQGRALLDALFDPTAPAWTPEGPSPPRP